MAARLSVITGATGLLGSHIAEQLIAQGARVRAIIRPTSNVVFLQDLGAELVMADLREPAGVRRAVQGADVVYHCAARVGEWGAWRDFQADIIDATRHVLQASRAAGVRRVLHVSSIAVYGHPRPQDQPFTESEPWGQRLGWRDYYCRAKMAAEKIVQDFGPLASVVRPSWIYGPRDRNTVPRLIRALRGGWISLLGSGNNLLNIVYAADVANHPDAGGQAYHICSPGEITQREVLDHLTEGLGLRAVRRRVPYRLAYAAAFLGEVFARLTRWKRSPYVTRYAIGLVARPARFSIDKARAQLGWQPRTHPIDGIRGTLAWFLQRECEGSGSAVSVSTALSASGTAPAGASERRIDPGPRVECRD